MPVFPDDFQRERTEMDDILFATAHSLTESGGYFADEVVPGRRTRIEPPNVSISISALPLPIV